jgi:hypothetical protein
VQRVEAADAVRRVYERTANRILDSEGTDDPAAIASLSEAERAVYVTRALEDELDDGGWYLVFANSNDHRIDPAIEAYELLGLPRYAELLRAVRTVGLDDDSPDGLSERLDSRYGRLTGAEQARARLIRSMGLDAQG